MFGRKQEPKHVHQWGPWDQPGDLVELAAFSWGVEMVSSDSVAYKEHGFIGYMQYRTCKDESCGLQQQAPVCEPEEDL